MGKHDEGLYDKFTVTRNDGKSAPGEKHDGCRYFVLDATHDPFAAAALKAYADACEAEYPALAADLRSLTTRIMCPHCGGRFSVCDLIPTHDWPPFTRSVCPGSGQYPRSLWDRRDLWNGERPPPPEEDDRGPA